MANISFKVRRTGNVNMILNTIKALKNFTPALKQIRKMQLRQIDEAFKVSGKNITGESWKPLRPNTVKQKISSGFLTNILVRTNKMRRSFKDIKLNKNTLQITSVGVPYFAQHQLGKSGSTFKAKLPRRQMLGHSPKMIKDALKITSDYIIKQAKSG